MDVKPVFLSPITEHFRWKEFFITRYHDLQEYEISEEVERNIRYLAAFLEGLRGIVGVPIHINSGYRSTALNRKVGGVPNSFHLRGLACDISTTCYNFSTFLKIASLLIDFKNDGVLKECIPHPHYIHIAIHAPKTN